jgi:hypothetical protein
MHGTIPLLLHTSFIECYFLKHTNKFTWWQVETEFTERDRMAEECQQRCIVTSYCTCLWPCTVQTPAVCIICFDVTGRGHLHTPLLDFLPCIPCSEWKEGLASSSYYYYYCPGVTDPQQVFLQSKQIPVALFPVIVISCFWVSLNAALQKLWCFSLISNVPFAAFRS